jgi:hypothetical protein
MRRLRERRAAALRADPATPVRGADELLLPAVRATLAALSLAPEDVGVAKLAERYAAVIDAADDLAWTARWVMPSLLACLESLHATPVSRAKAAAGKAGPPRVDWRSELRRGPGVGLGHSPRL